MAPEIDIAKTSIWRPDSGGQEGRKGPIRNDIFFASALPETCFSELRGFWGQKGGGKKQILRIEAFCRICQIHNTSSNFQAWGLPSGTFLHALEAKKMTTVQQKLAFLPPGQILEEMY